MKRLLIVAVVLAALGGVVAAMVLTKDPQQGATGTAPTGSKGLAPGKKIKVVATTGMIADAVRQVGGEAVDVRAMMGPGVDPHLYKASAGDVRRMSEAHAIYYNGLHLEGKLSEVLAEMRRRGKSTLAVAEQMPRARWREAKEFSGSFDPHVWFDVKLWAEVVAAISEGLAGLAPDRAGQFEQRAATYRAKLTRLEAEVRARIAKLPRQQRVLITAHDAFGYFARAYGFEVHGIQGVSTASEAGAADIKRLAALIVQRKVPAIFVESSVPPRVINALQAAVKSKGFSVRVGGQLYSDAMGTPGSGADNYLGMVRHNVETIVSALSRGVATGAEAPKR